MERIDLSAIRLDGGTQPRAAILEDVVKQYADDLSRGDAFPPLVLFFDGESYWLADGFHRYHAARAVGVAEIDCDVRQGTQRDAILYSVGCNADHGLRRTNEDKRRAALRLLNDPAWSKESANWIAAQCRVSQPFVARLKEEVAPRHLQTFEDSSRTAHRGGSTYNMNTAPIGRRYEPSPLPPMTQPSAPPIREAAFAAARADMDENGPIFDAIDAIKTHFGALPSAEEAARRFPRALRHTFSATQARHLGAWFLALADAWAIENGEMDVIAAE